MYVVIANLVLAAIWGGERLLTLALSAMSEKHGKLGVIQSLFSALGCRQTLHLRGSSAESCILTCLLSSWKRNKGTFLYNKFCSHCSYIRTIRPAAELFSWQLNLPLVSLAFHLSKLVAIRFSLNSLLLLLRVRESLEIFLEVWLV